jgi:hypothetical protein
MIPVLFPDGLTAYLYALWWERYLTRRALNRKWKEWNASLNPRRAQPDQSERQRS